MAAQNQSKGRNRPIVQLEKAVQLYLLWYSLTGPVRQFADYKLQLWQAEAGQAEVRSTERGGQECLHERMEAIGCETWKKS